MKFYFAIFFIFSLFISSCSSMRGPWDRSMASDDLSPLDIDQLLTIKASATNHQQVPPIDLDEKLKVYMTKRWLRFSREVDSTLSEMDAYKIVPLIDDQGLTIKILSSKLAGLDEEATNELVNFCTQLALEYNTSPSIYELYYNAERGDFTALQALAKIRLAAVSDISDYDKKYAANPEVDEGIKLPLITELKNDEKLDYWKDVNEKFLKSEKIYRQKKKIKSEARKAVMDTLDKVAEDQQFRNLVAKNDRKGAAQLLRSYLPWEEMPPFETNFWETQLSIMADPLPIEDRVLIYRGLGDDNIQTSLVDGVVLNREEAIKEQKIFVLSTLLTKNQGSWNRRLRSLTSMYDKPMGTHLKGSNEYIKAARIANYFLQHSSNPIGSPFLSYTPVLWIATSFGYNRKAAFFIDPRALTFNVLGLQQEVEFLHPLASFPDELAAVYDKPIHGPSEEKNLINEMVMKNLEHKYGVEKGEEIFNRISKNSASFFANPLDKKRISSPLLPIAKDSKNLFKTNLGKSSAAVSAAMKNDSDMPCLDLIQLFWK